MQGYGIRTVQELLGHKDVKNNDDLLISSTVDHLGFAAQSICCNVK